MMYSTQEQYEIATAITENTNGGRPEITQRINAGVEAQLSFTTLKKIWTPESVHPEVPVTIPEDSILEAPPKVGPGSSAKAWQAFAKQVSDMDHEVIDSMSRSDIVTILTDKGVIE